MAENFQKLMTVSNAHIQETQITIRRIITLPHTTYLHTCPFTSELKREKRERENVVGGYKIRSITCLQEKKFQQLCMPEENEYYLSNTETKLAKPEFYI